MKGKPNSILTDLLGVLSVPHTAEYSDSRCDSMPFKSLYGLSTLLKEYGVESVGYAFSNKDAICGVPAPFIAQTTLGLVIVNSINGSETEYTSCLCVQALLWLLFVVYLVGGWYSDMLPITSKFYALVAAYAVALLSLNRLFSFINRYTDGR